MPSEFSIIVATDEVGGIGKENKICWTNKEDLSFFRKTTTFTKNSNKINAIIMGRKTWESLPVSHLPNRVNIVITKTKINTNTNPTNSKEIIYFKESIELAFEYCETAEHIESIFVIGGEQIYNYCLTTNHLLNKLNKVYWTTILGTFNCDCFFRPPQVFYEKFILDITNLNSNCQLYIRSS